MKNDWEMVDHAHLHLIWPGDLDLWPLTLKLLSLRPLVNFYLHAKFERGRIKNDRVIESESRWEKNNNNTQKTEQKQKGLRLRRQTLIIIIIHKRQNKNIKVCRRSRADLNNSKEGTAESVKGQRAVAPLTLIIIIIIIVRKEQQNQ